MRWVRRFSSAPDLAETVAVRFPVVRRAVPKMERHSLPRESRYSSFSVITVPVLADAYSYVLVDHRSRSAALVDPCEPDLALRAAEEAGATVTAVLCTSHLDEAAGGNAALRQRLPKLRVYGCDARIAHLTHPLRSGALVEVGQQRLRALAAPGVTSGSAMFHVMSARAPTFSRSPNRNPHSVLFSGATLSVGGCGPLGSEGQPRQLHDNLVLTVGALPGDTEVFCAFEETVRNLEFANALAKGLDREVAAALDRARVTRSGFYPTVPALLEDEYTFNPFLRCNHGSVTVSAGARIGNEAAVDVLRRLLVRRDEFDADPAAASKAVAAAAAAEDRD